MEPVLYTKELVKTYGSGPQAVHAVNGVDIQVPRGQFVSIIGKSGSGKSTLLHMLGGLDNPTSGQVWVDKEDIARYSAEELAVFRRRKIGFVFQAYNLVPSLNIWENAVLPLGLDNQAPDKAHVEEIFATLGLQDMMTRLPSTLSGGQQQRAAIARALAGKPAIVLADEPTGNLDAKTGDEVISLLKVSARKFGQTLVVVTHDEDIAQMAEQVITLEDGKVVVA